MLLIKNGKLLTMEGKDFDGASVLVEGGKITAIGEKLKAPKGAQVIDAGGKWVLPGLVDAHTHLGVFGHGLRWEGSDANETTDAVTPHLRTLDAINVFDKTFADTLAAGVTTVGVSPGSANVICGQIAAIKVGGAKRVDSLVIGAPIAMKCALGENPKNAHGQSKKSAPLTRMSTAAIFREAFLKARQYLDKKEKAEGGKLPDFDMKHEALIPLLKREIPAHIHAHRADDIHTAIRLLREFGLAGVIVHCSEGHLIADDLLEAGFAALIGPTMGHAGKPETANKSFETAGMLNKKGVKIAITTDHPVIPLEHLNMCASLAVKAGMDETEALKAITIYPAEIMGLGGRIGSLKVGKDADISVWDKNPIDATSRAVCTVVNGKVEHMAESRGSAAK